MTRRTLIFLAAFLFFTLAFSAAFAQTMRSGNFTMDVAMHDTGGNMSSANFRTDISVYGLQGVANSSSQKVCLGFLCIEFGPKTEEIPVTFVLEVNISGTTSDTIVIDNNTSPGLFRAKDITRYFACIQDSSISGTPVIGIIYAGEGNFKYVRADPGNSFSMRLTQEHAGNRFVVPVTSQGCDVIKSRLPLSVPSIFTLAFVPFANLGNGVELTIKSPIDLIGNFERSGSFSLVMEVGNNQIVGEGR